MDSGESLALILHIRTKYTHTRHYRIVFKEIIKEKGIPLDRVKSLPDVMTVLIETVSGVF
jgi:hypothetical protein